MKLYDIEMNLYKGEDDRIFTFSGVVSYNFLTATSMVIKKDLEASGESSKKMTNLFAVVTEMFQNIMNYSARQVPIEGRTLGIGTCVIKRSADMESFCISTGNLITKIDEAKIRNKLDKIIALDRDGVKAYYKEIRRHGKDAHDEGAGLGFLEVAKKSKQKIKYEIRDVDEQFSYFEIEILV